nr:MAG TPA: hypothetical protein [Caudoviricetes sp.]
MRLIDADKFNGKVIASHTGSGVIKLVAIDDVPTDYDLDKVVKQLEELKKQNPFINGIRDNSIEAAASRQTLDYAIDIVKAGARQ